jgi:NAD(P)-dependent dehydrogenase (short-subunit alcohol dehydrogenase family)
MGRLDGHQAIVTGGGSGIGRAIALRFAAEGASVAICGRREQGLAETKKAIDASGGRCRSYLFDVKDIERADVFVDGVARDLGGVTCLVNNAGISGPTALSEVTPQRWREILATNCDGAYFMARAALRHIPDHANGRVINIATIGAQMPFPGWTAYCASKSALVGITRCLAMEVAPRGITVNAILPGWVLSDMQDAGVKSIAAAMGKSVADAMPLILSQVPLGRMSEPDEVAAMAVHLASAEGRGMTGSSTVISNGAYMG